MKAKKKGIKKLAVAGVLTVTVLGLVACGGTEASQNTTNLENTQAATQSEQASNSSSEVNEPANNNENNSTSGGLFTPQVDNLPPGVNVIDGGGALANPAVSDILGGMKDGVVEFAGRARGAGFEWVQDPDAMLRIEIPSTVSREEFLNLLETVPGAENALWVSSDGADFDAWSVVTAWAMGGGAPIQSVPSR